jgi:hypothetical protein
VRCEIEREVEGRDGGNDADRNSDRVAPPSGSRRVRVDRDAAAGKGPRLDRGEGQRLHTPVDLNERLLQRLADLTGEEAGELLAALADRGGGSVEYLRTLVRVQRLAHRLRGRRDGRPRLGRADERNRGERRAVPGGAHDTCLVARHRLAAHGQRPHGYRGFDLRHAASRSTPDELRCYTPVFPHADTPFAP